jgi:uncharacterized protein
MEQRLSVLTLGVKDLARSRSFYVGGLGWQPVYEDAQIVFFQAGGMVFGLFLDTELARDFDTDPASFGRAPISLGYNVSSKAEVDRLIEAAVVSGATLLKPPHDAVWGGYSGYFADPDGFAWEIAWNPAWKLEADGSLRFQ